MKKINTISLLIILCASLFSCHTEHDIDTVTLYDYQENEISIDNIKNYWNTEVADKDYINSSDAKFSISKFNMIAITDKLTNKKQQILIADTNKSNTKIAAKLIAFKDGFKLENMTIICYDCNPRNNIGINNGELICLTDTPENEGCTKVVIAHTDL